MAIARSTGRIHVSQGPSTLLPFLLAAVLVVVGLVLIGGSYVMTQNRLNRALDMAEIPVPGSGIFAIEKPGPYTVYYEYISEGEDGPIITPFARPNVVLNIVERDTQTPIEVTSVFTSENYSFGERAGYAVWSFEAPNPGLYYLKGEYPPAVGSAKPQSDEKQIILRVGNSVMKNVRKAAAPIIFGGLTGAVVILGGIVVAVMACIRWWMARR